MQDDEAELAVEPRDGALERCARQLGDRGGDRLLVGRDFVPLEQAAGEPRPARRGGSAW
jgi:hypothetical protein